MSTRPLLPSILKRPPSFFPYLLSHSVSTNSAINRGIRRSREPRDFDPRELPNSSHIAPSDYSPLHLSDSSRRWTPPSSISEAPSYTDAYPGMRSWRPPSRTNPRLDSAPRAPEWTPKIRRHIPKVDYNAEWIYGASVVEAALKAKRRKMFKLYIYAGENRTPENRVRDRMMSGLAADAGVEVVEERDGGLLDSMSNSRPNNGYTLECLPLPKPPILTLGFTSPSKSTFALNLAQHTPTNTPIDSSLYPSSLPNRDPKRYPFIIMLDSILDPGNLGAIIRTAYYLGASALTLSPRNCAPLSPIALKASAGAAEFLPVLEHSRSDRLILDSVEHGWTFYAAVPPVTKQQGRRERYVLSSEVGGVLEKGPVVLVLGGEGEGLRPLLKKCVEKCVSLERAPGTDRVVDSLNVSVAAALLCSSFLKGA